MNSYLALFHFLVVFLAAVSAAPANAPGDKSTLELLHVLFRHGDRTPDKMSLFPNDLYINFTYDPIQYSQLTVKGKETEYAIGKYIRDTYNDFIPGQYTPDVVYSISTNFKRTKMSLQLVLTGIFPPLLSDVFESGLNWQPIPANVEPAGGPVGLMNSNCPTYISAYYQYVMSKQAKAIMAPYQDLYAELTTFAGFDVQTPRDVAGIYVTLKCEENYGLDLPSWASGLYPDVLEEAASIDYEFSTATSTVKKYIAGFLLKKILKDSIDKKNGTLSKTRKIFLYSAHEFNVATMLRTLNVFYRHVPPFGATIFFEIHNINGVYGLKLFYQDYKQDIPKLLTIPGCGSFCPLDILYELVADSLPGDSDICFNQDEFM